MRCFEQTVDNFKRLEDFVLGLSEKIEENIIDEKVDQEILNHEAVRESKYRLSQSKFRRLLLENSKEIKCAICNINREELLIASHIKPWKDCVENEFIDINNGMLLCCLHDKLFDKGLISFSQYGQIIISKRIKDDELEWLNIHSNIHFDLVEKEDYMEYHRKIILK